MTAPAPLYLGVDIGGSKSHALLIDDTGQVVGFGQAGAGNHEQRGYEGLAAVLEEIVSQALDGAGAWRARIAGAGFGLCGYDWPSERAPHLAAIARLGLNTPIDLVNDALLGLYAGTDAGWGISVVAGTSCNCWGRDAAGREGHTVGMGQMVGEAGGGGELVQRALWAVSHAYTRLTPPTRLTEAFMTQVGAPTAEALIEGYCEGQYTLGARDAPLVFRVAAEGDSIAQRLVEWAGTELGNLVIAVVRQLDLQNSAFDVVQAGSFFRGSPHVGEALHARVLGEAPGARFLHLHAPPVVGAALLAMQTAGCPSHMIIPARRRLTRSAAFDTAENLTAPELNTATSSSARHDHPVEQSEEAGALST